MVLIDGFSSATAPPSPESGDPQLNGGWVGVADASLRRESKTGDSAVGSGYNFATRGADKSAGRSSLNYRLNAGLPDRGHWRQSPRWEPARRQNPPAIPESGVRSRPGHHKNATPPAGL